MESELPDRLAYLAPAMAGLEAFDPELLGDDNQDALDVVDTAVRARIRGLDPARARATIQQDQEILEDWLAQPGNTHSHAHFVRGALQGYLLYANFEELVG
jgi:hypothetical protein